MTNNDNDDTHDAIDVSDVPPPPLWTRADAQAHHAELLALWRRDHATQIGVALGMASGGYSTGVALTDRGRWVTRGEWVAR